MKLRIAMLLALSMLAACSSEPAASCDSVQVDSVSYCVYQNAITETGYTCPEGMPNMYRDDEFDLVACSNGDERPDFEAIDRELEQSGTPDGMLTADMSPDGEFPRVDVGIVLPCLERSIETCQQDPLCAVVPERKYDPVAECYRSQNAYCAAIESVCSNNVVTATDPEGGCWLMGGICELPAGWTNEEDSSSRTCPYDLEPCS